MWFKKRTEFARFKNLKNTSVDKILVQVTPTFKGISVSPVTLTGMSSTGPWTDTASSASAPSGTRMVNSAG